MRRRRDERWRCIGHGGVAAGYFVLVAAAHRGHPRHVRRIGVAGLFVFALPLSDARRGATSLQETETCSTSRLFAAEVFGRRATPRSEARMTRIPLPPYPNGWFKVCYSDELPGGRP